MFLSKLIFTILGLGADVITVTSGTAGNAGSTAAELITYMSAKLLEVAELITLLDQFGDKQPIPSNSSKTIRFVRLEKLSVSSSPTQLTEGIPPDAEPLTFNQFEATAEQYGTVIRISDLAELTARHDIVGRTMYILGLKAAELYDQLVYNVLAAGTTIYRPNARAANTALLASDTVSYVDLVELSAQLMAAGGRPFDDGNYVLVVQPQVYASLLKDPDFKASVQFKAPERIWKGEVNQLGHFRIVETNSPAFAATSQTTSGSANKFYTSFALAKFAYQVSDLQNLRVYVTPPGGQTDPLFQSRKIGFKFAFKTIITNQNWIEVVNSAGSDSTTY